MKIVCLLLFCSLNVYAGQWSEIFHDDFSGEKIDGSKWLTRYIYNGETADHFNDELQRYRDENITVSDGLLSLTLSGTVGNVQSGMVRSRPSFYYGYFEAKVLLPDSIGVWPAFWLVPDYDRLGKIWYPPEIDVFEYVQNGVENNSKMFFSATHGVNGQDGFFTYLSDGFNKNTGYYSDVAGISSRWVIFGLYWVPGEVWVFFNNELVYKKNFEWLGKDGRLAPSAQIILNLAFGGGWAGKYGVDYSSFPSRFLIDYVYVCQFRNGDNHKQCKKKIDLPGYIVERHTVDRIRFVAGDVSRDIRGIVSFGFRLDNVYPDMADQISVSIFRNGKSGKNELIKLNDICSKQGGSYVCYYVVEQLDFHGDTVEVKVISSDMTPMPIFCNDVNNYSNSSTSCVFN